jgi:hypothetical protein
MSTSPVLPLRQIFYCIMQSNILKVFKLPLVSYDINVYLYLSQKNSGYSFLKLNSGHSLGDLRTKKEEKQNG